MKLPMVISNHRRSLRLAAGVALVLAIGCQGGGGGEPIPRVSKGVLCESDTTVAANRITLECPASSAGALVVTVVIGGPSESSNIYGVKFDLVFDSDVLSFQDKMSTVSFLAKNGGNVGALASVNPSDPNRVVATLGLEGTAQGVQVTAPKETVMALVFDGQAKGTTTLQFENGQVVDSTLAPIASAEFAGSVQVEVQ